MPFFRYRAIFKERKIKGIVEAESLEEAKISLFKEGYSLFYIKEYHGKSMVLKRQELFNFTSELARLLKAHLPLYESLLTMEEKYRTSHLHPLVLDLSSEIKSGISFSNALKRHPKSFDFLFVNLVANAEKAGNLPSALYELSVLYEKGLRAHKEVVKALLYPSLVLIFSFIVIIGLLFFVIPSLYEIFEGRDLGVLTAFVLRLSHFVREKWITILFSFIASLLFFRFLATFSGFRQRLRSLFIKFFFLEPFFIKFSLSRFCRSLAALLKGGVPQMEGLKLASIAISYPPLKEIFEDICRRVEEGEKLHLLLENVKMVPPFMRRLMTIAEGGGNEIEILEHISDIFEEELEKNLAQITALIQPIMLIILGVIVGMMVLSILLPLTDVSSI